jgi:glycerol dehydrogenase-like iron-containing ADH family enzyme
MKKSPALKLPFVGEDHAEWSMWDVPLVAGYSASARVGSHLADIYLKHLREYGASQQHGAPNLLGNIITSMLDKKPRSEEEAYALKGQIVGFAEILSSWLYLAVRECGYNLDKVEQADLLTRANKFIEMSETDYYHTATTNLNQAEG